MILLTEEEIDKLPPVYVAHEIYEREKQVAKAQLKKVVEWLNSKEVANLVAKKLESRNVKYFYDEAFYITEQLRQALLEEMSDIPPNWAEKVKEHPILLEEVRE